MRTLIKMESKSLGDTIGASPYFEEYRIKTGEEVYVSCNFHELFQPLYTSIKFIPWGFLNSKLFDKTINLTFDFSKPLQKGFSDQLGLEWREIRPKVFYKKKNPPIEGRYVAIASQSTCQSKYWNNQGGWQKLIGHLNDLGLKVVSLDGYKVFGSERSLNTIPSNSIDKTGLSLDEVVNYLDHSEFFIGLSSGLSWLSHSVGKHTVLISGTTHDWCEFTTDVTRVINKKVCHGCFNEPEKNSFDPGDWLWCPRLKNTENQFICSKSITPEMVIDEMKKNRII